MDEIARFNKERWEELAQAGVEYSRPFLALDESTAQKVFNPQDKLGDVTGKDVSCGGWRTAVGGVWADGRKRHGVGPV